MNKNKENRKSTIILLVESLIVLLLVLILSVIVMGKLSTILSSIDSSESSRYCMWADDPVEGICKAQSSAEVAFLLSIVGFLFLLLALGVVIIAIIYFCKITIPLDESYNDNKISNLAVSNSKLDNLLVFTDTTTIGLIDTLYTTITDMETELTKYKYGKCLVIKNALVEKYNHFPISIQSYAESIKSVISAVEGICPILFKYEDLDEIIEDDKTIKDVNIQITLIKESIKNFILETRDVANKLD